MSPGLDSVAFEAGGAGSHNSETVILRLQHALAVSEASRAEAEADSASLRAALAAATEQLEFLLAKCAEPERKVSFANSLVAVPHAVGADLLLHTRKLQGKDKLQGTQLSVRFFKERELLQTRSERAPAAASSAEAASLEAAAACAESAAALEGELRRRAVACGLREVPVLGGARHPQGSLGASLARS